MTISNATMQWALSGSATPSGTNVTSGVTIGESLNRASITDADILYSFKVESALAGNVATLNLSSGAVAQTTGSPTITDAGTDFEGNAISTMVTLYGVYIECTGAGTTAVSGTTNFDALLATVGDRAVLYHPSGSDNLGTVTFTFTGATESVEVVVMGKTT